MAASDAARPTVLRAGHLHEPFVDAEGEPLERIMFGATWDDPDFDIDMCAVLTDPSGHIMDQRGFVYRRNRSASDNAVFVVWKQPGEEAGIDRAQVLINLSALDPAITAVTVALTAVMRGRPLAEAGRVRTRVMDLSSGRTPFVFSPPRDVYANARCMELWKVERFPDGWSVSALGQPYPGGPSAFAQDHGFRPR